MARLGRPKGPDRLAPNTFQQMMLTCPIGMLRLANWPCIYVKMLINKNQVLTARRCGRCRSCKDRKKHRGRL